MSKANTERLVEQQWNSGLIAASIAISLLGAFTSTQMMCQARMSLSFSSVLVWTFLASLTFGFCSIWCLHFVAMLACELDLLIGVNVWLTVLSSFLAVFFTFAALASDLLWDRYRRQKRKQQRERLKQDREARRTDESIVSTTHIPPTPTIVPFKRVEPGDDLHMPTTNNYLDEVEMEDAEPLQDNVDSQFAPVPIRSAPVHDSDIEPLLLNYDESSSQSDSQRRSSSDPSASQRSSMSQRSSSLMGSNASSLGLGNLLNIAFRGTVPAKNAFHATGEMLYHGFTWINVMKGLCWSLAITSMHYAGIFALHIPGGYPRFDLLLMVASGLISWVVCIIGCIFMPQMETHLSQQLLFSVVATSGVAAMHFTGMRATTFWSNEPPSKNRGYPPLLAIAVTSIAITTCILANGLLAHTATVSRNKLAEIVWTRRKLWRTIAQKENAEAAALARSDFIASASHEIRTPLHHLQGYSDLLSRTELTEEGRVLLYAIQRATKTLSLITNNVLDWSKLERETEPTCRPVALDIRMVCESILILLPNQDDDLEVEILVVVKPEVPQSLFLDETYIHRILMNLLSNALKFTDSGYVFLLLEMKDGSLVVSVEDTGCGIPHTFLPQLFEPFKQAQSRIGSQRGTGIGLSIVKQLLAKMGGTITVQSRHPDSSDVELEKTGSTFTVTIPVQDSSISEPPPNSPSETTTIAIFSNKNTTSRSSEGLFKAFGEFGWDVVKVESFEELSSASFNYIWADASFLDHNPVILRQLLAERQFTSLVPYSSQGTLDRLPGILTAPHLVSLPKPLMWHTFEGRISLASQISTKTLLRTVRFASTIDILEGSSKLPSNNGQDLHFGKSKLTSKNMTVLMVEDNPINQKLGTKMLQTLGYIVLVANNGAEALSQLLLHDSVIDAILMDQSMPLKDGVAATREIREMERNGVLCKRRPIIAVTAVVSTESRMLFKQAGADDFLSKPLGLKVLERTLGLYLGV